MSNEDVPSLSSIRPSENMTVPTKPIGPKPAYNARNVKPIGESYIYTRDNNTGEQYRVYANGKRVNLSDVEAKPSPLTGMPASNFPAIQDENGEFHINTDALCHALAVRYDAKVARIQLIPIEQWKTTPKIASLLHKSETLPKTNWFHYQYQKVKIKIKLGWARFNRTREIKALKTKMEKDELRFAEIDALLDLLGIVM